jgi:hypothetical protein
MQNGEATLEDVFEVSYRTKHKQERSLAFTQWI